MTLLRPKYTVRRILRSDRIPDELYRTLIVAICTGGRKEWLFVGERRFAWSCVLHLPTWLPFIALKLLQSSGREPSQGVDVASLHVVSWA
jgi:hypothetical protein